MLFWGKVILKERLPDPDEWRPLFIYGILNVTIYLGFFVLGMKEVSAGIGSLSTATNPLFISLMSAFYLGRKVSPREWAGLLLGMLGVGLAAYPLLQKSVVTPLGLFYLLVSMLAYSAGTIFYAQQTWRLPRLAINGWQVLLGGVFLVPFTWFFYQETANTFDPRYWLSVAWLVLPVSVVAVQLWLYLLKSDTVRASLWLFLCPIFGFLLAWWLLNEPITIYTLAGTALVLCGLGLGQKK